MAVARAVLLLTLAMSCLAAVHADRGKNSLLFVNWLSQQTSAKVSKASYYEEVETESACLQEVALRNCRCLHTYVVNNNTYCPHDYVETKLAPCKDPRYGSHSSLLPDVDSIGVCSFSEEFLSEPVTYEGTATTKIGIFTATCELHEDAESAGEPLCEGMSLSVQGDILRYPTVAFRGGVDVTPDEACKNIAPNPPVSSRAFRARKSAAANKKVATAAAKTQYGGDEEYEEGPSFYVGQGDIYSGTFWVISRHKKVPYHTGQFQLVFASGELEETYAPPDKSYTGMNNAITLEFSKGSGSY